MTMELGVSGIQMRHAALGIGSQTRVLVVGGAMKNIVDVTAAADMFERRLVVVGLSTATRLVWGRQTVGTVSMRIPSGRRMAMIAAIVTIGVAIHHGRKACKSVEGERRSK